MRLTLLILALLTIVSAQIAGQSCPSTPALGNENYKKYWLEGTVGSKRVRMYLEAGGEAAIGVLYRTDDWNPLMLGGQRGKNDNFQLTDKTEGSLGTGSLKGQLTVYGLTGTWIALKTGNKSAIRLKFTPEPRCELGSGPWREFDDPRWPITFSYPALWHIEVHESGISITCPDPSLMAYDGFDISFTQGKWTVVEDREINFTRCGNKWYGPTCECSDLTGLFCEDAALVKEQSGMRIIFGTRQEWRGYCRGGGYVGSADGQRRVFLMDDKWIEIVGQGPPHMLIDRIVGTVKRR